MKAPGWRQSRQPLRTAYRHVRPSAARNFTTSHRNDHLNVNDEVNDEINDNAHHNANHNATNETPPTTVQIDPENKTVKTVVGDLPISPLMDPAFHHARRKFTEPKPRATEHKPTKFQRRLARNPYAQALATPVRRCPVTKTTLPSFFLQKLTLRSHPETGAPYFVPGGLDSKVPTDAGDETLGAAEGKKPQSGPSGYILSRQRLLQELQRPNSVHSKGYKNLLRMSDHGHTNLGSVLNHATWRSDMDLVVLEMMRRRAAEGLAYFAKMVETESRDYIVKCERWDDVKPLKHKGCLLYLGPPEGTPSGSGLDSVPPRLSTLDAGHQLVVHNLRDLLGEEHVSRLRQGSELFREGSLFLLVKLATVNLQLLLWKLQGYMGSEGSKGMGEAKPSTE